MSFRQNKIVKFIAKTATYGLFCLALAVVIIIYTPLANILSRPLIIKADLQKADVIVVLGGGIYPDGGLSWFSLMRTVKGVELYKKGYADKILFSGCTANPNPLNVPEENGMARIAVNLGVPTRAILLEEKSTRTYESALKTAEMMKENGLTTALLVTSASHMKRSMLSFEHAGVKVFAAPVEPVEMYANGSMGRLFVFKAVMREYAGLVLYKARGWI
jgi:uncharacterized SAM-binding protein YcdF (DUF218 family)